MQRKSLWQPCFKSVSTGALPSVEHLLPRVESGQIRDKKPQPDSGLPEAAAVVAAAVGLSGPRGRRRYIIYCRYSDKGQTGSSIENQNRRIDEHLKRLGLDHFPWEIIIDEGVSGRRESRPGWDKIRQIIANKELAFLIVTELSRIDRDNRGVSIIRDIMFQKGRVICITDGIDTNERSWTMRANVANIQHSSSSEFTSIRVHDGLKGRLVDGNSSAGDVPYGYSSVYRDPPGVREGAKRSQRFRKDVVIHEASALVIRLIFQLFISGMRVTAIARRLQELQKAGMVIPPSKFGSNEIKPYFIRTILRNSKYAGLWYWGVTELKLNGEGKPCAQHRDEGPVVTIERPDLRIIDEATWNSAQAIIRKQKEIHDCGEDARGPKVDYRVTHVNSLTRGLVYCGKCGAKMHVTGNTNYGKMVGCPNRDIGKCDRRALVPVERCEQKVAEFLATALVADRAWVASVMNHLKTAIDTEADKLPQEQERLKARLATVEKQIGNLVDLIAEEGHDETVKTKLSALSAEKGELKHQLAVLGPVTRFEVPTEAWVLEQLADLRRLLGDADPESLVILRQTIGKITSDAVVTPGKKNGYSVIRFTPNLPGLVLALVAKKLPPAFGLLLSAIELPGGLREVTIALGQPTRPDKMAAEIYRLRQEGKSWRQVHIATGIPHGNAHHLYKRHQKFLDDNAS